MNKIGLLEIDSIFYTLDYCTCGIFDKLYKCFQLILKLLGLSPIL